MFRKEYYGDSKPNIDLGARLINSYFNLNKIAINQPFSFLNAMNYYENSGWIVSNVLGGGTCNLATLLYRAIFNYEKNFDGVKITKDKLLNDVVVGTVFNVIKFPHYSEKIAPQMIMPDLIEVFELGRESNANRDFIIKINDNLPKDLAFYFSVYEDSVGNFYANLSSNYSIDSIKKYLSNKDSDGIKHGRG